MLFFKLIFRFLSNTKMIRTRGRVRLRACTPGRTDLPLAIGRRVPKVQASSGPVPDFPSLRGQILPAHASHEPPESDLFDSGNRPHLSADRRLFRDSGDGSLCTLNVMRRMSASQFSCKSKIDTLRCVGQPARCHKKPDVTKNVTK